MLSEELCEEAHGDQTDMLRSVRTELNKETASAHAFTNSASPASPSAYGSDVNDPRLISLEAFMRAIR